MLNATLLPALPLRGALSNPHTLSTGKKIGTLIIALGLGSIAWSTTGDLSVKRASPGAVPQSAVERPMYQWYRFYRTSVPFPLARHTETANREAASRMATPALVKISNSSTAR